ncbi:MAG: 2-C-methyl-D-erythritol 2,4-cyclodiphosphate synthase [Clostridia bacterium]|nr:2-C-methyl-D-erythritol 2,4-cyclodiphosphate synthase [Clostridia bacterium]
MTDFRVGHGYDVHRFAEDRKLILGGVEIDFELGLLGHSDADVLLHAVSDALLGAAGLTDIGKHFPDTDATFKNIDSRILLRRVAELIKNEGYSVSNVDCTIVAQKPKLAPHIQNMKQNIAKDLSIDETRVNVKATTEEGLGFTGEMKGISAHAVALIVK